jgi:hypothetical protein
MLVFVYPLKMVFSALFAWVSGGWLPTSFILKDAVDLPRLFVIYGLGFCVLTGLISLLYVRAMRAAGSLGLNRLERLKTREEIISFGVLAATALISCLWAGLLPHSWGVWAGFWYATLPVSMSLVAVIYDRKARRLAGAQASTSSELR